MANENHKPTFSWQISFGNLVQMGVLLVGITGGWFIIDGRSQGNQAGVLEIKALVLQMDQRQADYQKDVDVRLRFLENQWVRSDERYTSILTLIGKIDGRLERIEAKP